MAEQNTTETNAADASRRNGAKGGRPSKFGPKTKRRELKWTEEGDQRAVAAAAALGCSVIDALEIAVRELDVAGYLARQS